MHKFNGLWIIFHKNSSLWNKYLTLIDFKYWTNVLILSAMDYIVGFICGFALKEILAMLKRVSDWDYNNRLGYTLDLEPFSEDDLP